MVRGLVLVVMIAACGFQPHAADMHAGDGGADATDGAIPIDAIDGSPLTDTDGDGVFDDTDNCIAVVNPDQHDEDGDHVGDACDACPFIANAIGDTDGDGVPDACDPHPMNVVDTLVSFAPFSGTTLPAGWIGTASMVVAGDVLTIDGSAATQILHFDTQSQRHAIDFVAEISATPGGTSFVTALTDLKDDFSQYFGCGIRVDTATREFVRDDSGTFTTVATDPAPAQDPLTFPGTYHFISIIDANQTCVIPGAMNRHKMAGNQTDNNRTNVGVRVGIVTAKIHYIAVYTF